MEEKFKDFYDTLIENLDAYNGEYASFIDQYEKIKSDLLK